MADSIGSHYISIKVIPSRERNVNEIIVKRLRISGGFLAFGELERDVGGVRRRALGFGRTDALDFYTSNALAVHFDDGEMIIVKIKTFAALGNEPELVEHEAADGGVGGIFGQGDVVLGVEVANVGGAVEDHGAICQWKRLLDNVKFVVNFADHLLDDVFNGDQPENAAKSSH